MNKEQIKQRVHEAFHTVIGERLFFLYTSADGGVFTNYACAWDNICGKALVDTTVTTWDRDDFLEKPVTTREKLLDICKEFCERVERGEVRSKKTYAKIKAVLEEEYPDHGDHSISGL